MIIFGESIPEDTSGFNGDPADWMPEHAVVGDFELQVVADSAPATQEGTGLTRPTWVYEDANSHDPDFTVPKTTDALRDN